MKILMLNHEFPPVGGGASTVTLELCRALVEQGHRLDVVTMHFGRLPRRENIDGVEVYRTPAWRRRADISGTAELATYFPGAAGRAMKLCRANRYDIIHCHFLVPGAPLALYLSRRTGIPYMVTCHGSDVPGHNPNRFKLMHRLIMPAWKLLARSSQIVSPSEFLKARVVAHQPSAEVHVIPNGINSAHYDVTAKEKRIVMAGRMLEFKGFQYGLKAMKPLPPGWSVDVVGDGDYLPRLKAIAAEDNIPATFHGWLDRDGPELRHILERGSIFVFPSESENWPTVLMEAMRAGMAIIASSAGGCPEVVGDAAVLVPPRDPAAIAEQLENLIRSPALRAQLSQAAVTRSRLFAWEVIAQRYVEFYRNVINLHSDAREHARSL